MTTILCAFVEPDLTRMLQAPSTHGANHPEYWDLRFCPSLAVVADRAARLPGAILLVRFSELTDELMGDLRLIRRASPQSALCALLRGRPLLLNESRQLLKCGVNFLLEDRHVANADVLIRNIHEVCKSLSLVRVASLLRERLDTNVLALAESLLRSLARSTDEFVGKSARLKRARFETQIRPPLPLEQIDIAVRLLLLIDLIECCGRSASALSQLCGFPSAKDATEMLRTYAGTDARLLNSLAHRMGARERLIQILRGEATPERRRFPSASGISAERSDDQTIRRSDDQTIRRSDDQTKTVQSDDSLRDAPE